MEYPGSTWLHEYAADHCIASFFARYVGLPYAQSTLEVGTIVPTSESWARENDRELACYVWHPLWKLHGTVRGSRQ